MGREARKRRDRKYGILPRSVLLDHLNIGSDQPTRLDRSTCISSNVHVLSRMTKAYWKEYLPHGPPANYLGYAPAIVHK